MTYTINSYVCGVSDVKRLRDSFLLVLLHDHGNNSPRVNLAEAFISGDFANECHHPDQSSTNRFSFWFLLILTRGTAEESLKGTPTIFLRLQWLITMVDELYTVIKIYHPTTRFKINCVLGCVFNRMRNHSHGLGRSAVMKNARVVKKTNGVGWCLS